MSRLRHLLWIVYGASVGFGVSFIFGDTLVLPVDLYYFIYFVIITLFFARYVQVTQLRIREVVRRRLGWGIALAVILGALMVGNVLSRPETPALQGPALVGAIVWRGVIYGLVDGLLLTTFPWIVTWRAFEAESKPMPAKIGITLLAWVFVLVMTTAYHAGYSDFRSTKIVQPNIGNSLISIATFASANPLASPLAHAAMHIAAVIHSPGTSLYLPPHR